MNLKINSEGFNLSQKIKELNQSVLTKEDKYALNSLTMKYIE